MKILFSILALGLFVSSALTQTVEWSKTIGGDGHYEARYVQQTSEGGYIITGSTTSSGSESGDIYVLKTDSQGNTLWSKTLGGTGWDMGFAGQQTSDGNETWSKTFGGENSDFGYAVSQTSDGGYIVVGETDTMGGVENTAVYLIRTDAAGNEVWSATYGGDGNSEGFCVQQTEDGGYIVVGNSDAFIFQNEIYLIKIAPEDPGFTPAGANIEVTPVAPGGETPVTLLFSNVTQSGITSLTVEDTGPIPPEGFSLGNPPTYYNLTTTAQFSGNITVCIDYSDVTYTDVTQLQLFHYENDTWTPVTVSNDIIGKKICGVVTSFSSFAVFEETQPSLPPVLNPVADHTVLWPPNHKMVDIVIETNVSSPGGLPVTVSAVVSSNEPVNGLGDGNLSPDWTEPVVSPDNAEIRLQLRAERSGTGTGRIYTVSITAEGQPGLSTTMDIQIAVPINNKRE